jgi:Glycosyltransferase family 87
VTRRSRALAGALFVAAHLAFLAPLANNASPLVEGEFGAVGEEVLDGAEPYSDLDFEYPPFAIGVAVGPAAVTGEPGAYTELFGWGMLGADLAIVVMLAAGVRGRSRRVLAALGAYSLAVALLLVRVRPGFDLDTGTLLLHRYDVIPAALVLGAALARQADRSATWSALLSVGAATKAFPAALFPALLRGERRPARVVVAALVPLAAAALLVLALGDQFWSAVTYHTDRDLQVETVGASVVMLADLFGGSAEVVGGGGSFNLDGTGSEFLRALSIVALLTCYAFAIRQIWVRRVPPLESALMALTPLVVFAPVLSPQFLIWLLPLSAAVYGFRSPNVVLIGACLLTGLMLSHYDEVFDLSWQFVAFLGARNALLLIYLALVLAPLWRQAEARAPRPRPVTAG